MTSRRPREPRLPDTTYAVLGLLTFGERSGYDLGKLIESSIAHFFFKPAKSQIYLKLRRLVAEGYATERSVAQQDRPDKRLYRITSDGEQALRAWLHSSEVEADQFTSPLLLKVFFGDLVARPALHAQITKANQQAKESLAQLHGIQREINSLGGKDRVYPQMVLRAGLGYMQAWARSTADMAEELEKRGLAE